VSLSFHSNAISLLPIGQVTHTYLIRDFPYEPRLLAAR
jgi:hypothetical protein